MSTKRMKAIRLHEFGGPEVLLYEEIPVPELKQGEVLVRVNAVGINPETGTYAMDLQCCLPHGDQQYRCPLSLAPTCPEP